MHNSQTNKEKCWVLKDSASPIGQHDFNHIADMLNIHPIVAKLLAIRGFHTPRDMDSFLSMESERLCNPFDLMDMEKGVLRIAKAVGNRERITIYGDYDVDGVTSVSTLYLYLTSLGADVSYYIPNRTTDGYGVTCAAIDSLAAEGTRLIITVDTGITANDEVEYAKTLGIDFVITDHHECRSELPRAVAVINPHRPDCPYPFKELAGVGVVFKLISAYEEKRSGKTRIQVAGKIFSEYADLVAIGTIADVMPIHEENRIIVSYGLRMIENNRRIGLSALIDAAQMRQDAPRTERRKKRVKISSGYIGYTLAPRINAAGRIRSATMAVELFLSSNYEKAFSIAQDLCLANKDRQSEENQIIIEAYEQIEKYGSLDENPVIVLDADNWHHGVIGIVASRITEKYCRPSILVSFEGSMGKTPSPDDVGKGSGRSIKGLNLVDALCHCQDTLVKFGGHELAAGLSVTREMLPKFREKINRYCLDNLHPDEMVPTVEADLEISLSDLSLDLAQGLSILEPYGVGNPVPTFVIRNVTVNEILSISDGKHTKMSIGDGVSSFTAMYFSQNAEQTGLNVGDLADVLFTIDVNEWNGRRTLQLIVKDVRLSSEERARRRAEKARFEEIWGGAPISADEDVVPTREEFAALYRVILMLSHQGIHTITHRDLMWRLNAFAPNLRVGYIKLKLIIKVMMELNIVGIEENEDSYHFRVRFHSGKTDLEKSGLLRRLRSQQKG